MEIWRFPTPWDRTCLTSLSASASLGSFILLSSAQETLSKSSVKVSWYCLLIYVKCLKKHLSFFTFSSGLTYSTLSLLSTVAFLLIATHYNKWQLNKTYGVVLMLWYLLFMILASLYELNVFGEFNPPECDSTY